MNMASGPLWAISASMFAGWTSTSIFAELTADGDAGQNTGFTEPVERAEGFFIDAVAAAQVGQLLGPLQADHHYGVWSSSSRSGNRGRESGAVGEDQEEPVRIVAKQLGNAGQH